MYYIISKFESSSGGWNGEKARHTWITHKKTKKEAEKQAEFTRKHSSAKSVEVTKELS